MCLLPRLQKWGWRGCGQGKDKLKETQINEIPRREGSAVQSADHSFREPWGSVLITHITVGRSQTPGMPAPGDLMFLVAVGSCAHAHTLTHVHIVLKIKVNL